MAFRLHDRAVSRSIAGIGLALLLSAGLGAPAALAGGLFVGMGGKWKGDGSISWTTGETEHLRCTATYEEQKEGNRIVQSLTCATDSTRLIISSTITFSPDAGAITGSWSEETYGINGFVTGTASTGSVKALVQSTDHRFKARVNVVTKGSSQSVSIAPEGLDVTSVTVQLKKNDG